MDRLIYLLTCVACSGVVPASAQTPVAAPQEEPQFVLLEGAFPGPTYWTEALAFADVENDGDLDVFLARGEGWMSQGRKHQNGLYLNRLEEGALRLEDKSVERLGYSESHAKDVVAADVNADGFQDVLFANAFNTAPPFLFINRGSERPGHFQNESDTRGLTETLSSAAAVFGDVDDDGDLDLVLADNGPRLLGTPGGRARMYLNDGAGAFREAPGMLSAPLKVGLMGLHLADIDGDFDLDLFAPHREGEDGLGHYLLLNDGAGSFHDASIKLPETTGGVYEAETADMDGDSDLDLFFISLSETDAPGSRFPLGEGPVRNLLSETGQLDFEKGVALGKDDDNELVLIDYDQDGDLDAIIGSLGPQEKVLRNEGDLVFKRVDGLMTVVADPSLDIGAADLDNDGATDLVTVQGLERVGAEQPPCQVFLNRGPRDRHAPRLLAEELLPDPSPPSGPFVVHASVQDDVIADGQAWIAGEVLWATHAEPPRLELNVDDFKADGVERSLQPGTRLTLTNTTSAPIELTLAQEAGSRSAMTLAPDASHTQILLAPGVHTWRLGAPSRSAHFLVEGQIRRAPALVAGSALLRFEMEAEQDPPAVLSWQLLLRDRAGNQSWGQAHAVELRTPPPRKRRERR